MYRILLVEDDAALADAITQVLTAWGHEVHTGYNGRGGQKSTGLGLYLVHQTAEMLHCRVSLSSRIGEGTSVTIDLHQEELGKE